MAGKPESGDYTANGNPDSILMELLERVASLETKVEDIDGRLRSVEEKVDRIMEMLASQRNGILKLIIGTFVTIIVVILSFVATMFGLGWRPPTP